MNEGLKNLFKVLLAYAVAYAFAYGVSEFYIWVYKQYLKRKYRGYNKEFKSQETKMNIEEACKILGIKKEDLKKMSKQDLKKAYWRKAQEAHPDHGGTCDDFNKVKEAFDFAYAA